MPSSDIVSLYKNHRFILWVEDQETKAYFSEVWQGKPFGYLIGGGAGNIRAIVETAQSDGLPHVFGIVDRDFGRSNIANWTVPNPSFRVYRLESHEMENLLLDAPALHGCTLNVGNKSENEIEQRLLTIAGGMIWWMAARRVLAEVRQNAMEGFPSHPGRNSISDLASASQFILASQWFSMTAAGVSKLASKTDVEAELHKYENVYRSSVHNGNWHRDFSGKELFRDIQGYVYMGGSGSSARVDLVKAVGKWQVDNGKVPAEVVQLGQAIENRIPMPAHGLPPTP